MKERTEMKVLAFIFLTIGLAGLGFGSVLTVGRLAYKQGQVDYANGKVVYELQKQPDGNTEWVKK